MKKTSGIKVMLQVSITDFEQAQAIPFLKFSGFGQASGPKLGLDTLLVGASIDKITVHINVRN